MTWLKQWVWPAVLAVLAVFAIQRANRQEKQADKADERIRDIHVDDMEQRHREIEKDIQRSQQARKRAADAKAKAEQRIKDLGKADPAVGDLMDRYRAAGVHDATDASRN